MYTHTPHSTPRILLHTVYIRVRAVYTCARWADYGWTFRNFQALGDSIYGNGVALLATFNRNTNLGGLASLDDIPSFPFHLPCFQFFLTAASLDVTVK
jgi:hypothetical protein